MVGGGWWVGVNVCVRAGVLPAVGVRRGVPRWSPGLCPS